MPPSLIFFTGAPPAESLEWDEDHLLKTFEGPIARFTGLDTTAQVSIIPATFEDRPAWRSLPLVREQLPTGLSQTFDKHQVFESGWQHQSHGASFFTTSQVESLISQLSQDVESQDQPSSLQSVEEVLSQFYEESYARHEDVQSSQIAPASESGSSFTSDELSYESASFDSISRPRGNVPIAGHLSNLKDMPNANHLDSIQPQTMTVNLIVGIISMPQPRNIKTRRGANVELIEVLVGDETKSGFAVNFWLSSSQPVVGDMRSVLQGLRPQDVVLMRNVALSSFKRRVYGQSLRKEMTKVHLLYRNRVDRDDVGGCYTAADLLSGEHVQPQVEKTRRTREWVMRFVGVGVGPSRQNRRSGKAIEVAKEALPPDTQ
ncbi:uncharacterized protein LY89DRAFT_385148 [Mollisia scopiformis]|uniref:Uncharacterized protein n=1 Tax=Mollisia scopiformis TaxID=149040 RepID=A0A194XQ02_MOLSC|nr:uncharacterized protein LY89DRAFT_385148 [Mollisia scopiformis]KUJ21822.1 hypothetical protein LY89DRAFT_385148 [Mollisia scopiformis]